MSDRAPLSKVKARGSHHTRRWPRPEAAEHAVGDRVNEKEQRVSALFSLTPSRLQPWGLYRPEPRPVHQNGRQQQGV